MKKYRYFLIIIFIIIALSLTIIIKSVNGDNNSNLILAEEEQANIENDYENVIEESEISEDDNNSVNDEVSQSNIEIAENYDQTQIQETQTEEKVISSIPKIDKTTQAVKTATVDTTSQETKKETVKVETSKAEEPKQEETKKTETSKCSGNNHGVGTGNSGKWFNSESEAISYYKSIIKSWGEKWEKFEIDDETYQKNCPYGYEDWSCPYCGKWTINFYYN
jgi:hypothetical protein